PDDVLVQDLPDLLGLGNAAQVRVALLVELLLDDLVAQLDALVADVNAGTGDQLLDLLLHLAAEGALELALLIAELEHDASPSSLRSGVFPLLLSAADAVDDTVFHRLFGGHVEIALGVFLHLLDGLAGVLRQDLVDDPLQPQDLPGFNLDLGRLTPRSAPR